MGAWFKLLGGKEFQMLFLGCKGSGKTKLFENINQNRDTDIVHKETQATLGKKMDSFKLTDKLQITSIEVGGHESFWDQWSEPMKNISAMVFVVDIMDMGSPNEPYKQSKIAFKFAYEQLCRIRQNRVPIAIVLNKFDLLFTTDSEMNKRLVEEKTKAIYDIFEIKMLESNNQLVKVFSISAQYDINVFPVFQWCVKMSLGISLKMMEFDFYQFMIFSRTGSYLANKEYFHKLTPIEENISNQYNPQKLFETALTLTETFHQDYFVTDDEKHQRTILGRMTENLCGIMIMSNSGDKDKGRAKLQYMMETAEKEHFDKLDEIPRRSVYQEVVAIGLS